MGWAVGSFCTFCDGRPGSGVCQSGTWVCFAEFVEESLRDPAGEFRPLKRALRGSISLRENMSLRDRGMVRDRADFLGGIAVEEGAGLVFWWWRGLRAARHRRAPNVGLALAGPGVRTETIKWRTALRLSWRDGGGGAS